MPKSVLRSALLVSALASVTLLAWRGLAPTNPSSADPLTSTSAGASIERVRGLSALTTLRVDVADAVEAELRGYTGTARAVVVARGDVTLGVDLAAARFEAVECDRRRAVLVLGPPRVLTVRLDHERTRLVGIYGGGLWPLVPGGGDADRAAVNRAFRDAQRAVAAVADDPAVHARARRQAEAVVGSFADAVGWRVAVRWAD